MRTRPALLVFVTRNADRTIWQVEYLHALRRHVLEESAVVVLASRSPWDVEEALDTGYACLGSFKDAAAHFLLGDAKTAGIG